MFPTAAFAQSTGSQDFEQQAIIVTGTRTQDVGGVQAPDTSKAKAVLTQEIISRQNPGQTILDTINLVPGVSFQNNDAYGSSGGTLTIRGFNSNRISLTFDGIPLNDSGNYAIFSNQQLDPELIEQVNVSMGSTDVDSPTASAVGGTVNYRTLTPTKEFGGRVLGSLGEFDFRRIFAMINTGEIGPWGTRAFVSVSNAKNDNPFNNYGVVDKQQYNAKIYQPLGSNGDFFSIAGNYNRNRNNFFGSVRLRTDRDDVPNAFPTKRSERKYDINFPCSTDTPQAGVADTTNSCGTEFDRRFNPSNTGNIRVNSRFTLTDSLTLTIDPSYQYVKANGGGTVSAREGFNNIAGVPYTGYFTTSATGTSATPFFGRDLNGDGDILDQVSLLAPSQTQTDRYGVIAGLRWRITDDHLLRAGVTYDHAFHRQTGQVGFLDTSGEPLDVFPVNDPVNSGTTSISTTDGVPLQKRDRKSEAILKQVAAEYVGSFIDKRLTVNVGVRAPFFVRELQNNCFTVNPNGNAVTCFSGDSDAEAAYLAANPYVVDPITGKRVSGFSPPQKRTLKYDKLLPNIGVVFDITPRISAFASYAKGLSVPGTDQLYSSFFFPEGTEEANPRPEITDTFEGGLRYRSSKIQAQIGIWKTLFKDRIAESFDPELNASTFRNLGDVHKWGFDGSIAYAPIRQLTLYGFGSWNESDIQDNLQIAGPASFNCDTAPLATPADRAIARRNCAFTSGKEESGTPKYTYGVSALASLGDFDFGVTAKRTGPRFVFDTNESVLAGDVDVEGGITQLFPSKTPAYWLVNLDLRYTLRALKGLEKSYLALNVYNLFDELYVGGGFSGLNQSVSTSGVLGSAPFAQIGAPRTISGSLNIAW
ncbi:MAG: TonB-dependent receptor [Sphingomonas bacterium]|nr:TonB-dependent receptor [Sphingomonas bacterium]